MKAQEEISLSIDPGLVQPLDQFGESRSRTASMPRKGVVTVIGGQWDGKEIIPADYVAAATSAAGSSPNVSNGYGWLWWVGTESGRTFFARGSAGS